ncbi:MAG TPA: hypothetical protein VGV37_05760, partial [Aliidongia sp.]|uniref:hypothetical protein n=1 Tax=Aliidongia sp. TaxID=1914230 RepID=UPI002DDD2470
MLTKSLAGHANQPDLIAGQADSIKLLAKPDAAIGSQPTLGDVVDQASSGVQQSLDASFPPALSKAISAGDWKNVTAISQKLMGGTGSTPASIYTKAQSLAELAPSSADCQGAIQAAFSNLVVKPAAAKIAAAYKSGGSMAGAAQLRQTLTGAPPEVAQMIFTAAKPTIDAMAKELGKSTSYENLPPTIDSYLQEQRQDQQNGIPATYPEGLWSISSVQEYNQVYGDVAASVELASRGPNPGAAAQQVASDILDRPKSDLTFLTPLPGQSDGPPLSGAITQSVANGDGAVLSLALAQHLAPTGAASSAPKSDGTTFLQSATPEGRASNILTAISAGLAQLQKNNDAALKTFLTPPSVKKSNFGASDSTTEPVQQMAARWAPLLGTDKTAAALQKLIDNTPALKNQVIANQKAADQSAANVVNTLLDLKGASPEIQKLSSFGTLDKAATSLQTDKSTEGSISVSQSAQSAIKQATLARIGQQDPMFKNQSAPPNLLWSSRIARGIIAEIAGVTKPVTDANKLRVLQSDIGQLSAADQVELFGTSNPSQIIADALKNPGANGSVSDLVQSLSSQLSEGDVPTLTPRGGLSPITLKGTAMTGVGSALYLVGAWDLLKTPFVKGQDPVPVILNRVFGGYILLGGANNGYLAGSSFAQNMLVGENSRLFSNSFSTGGLLDKLTRPVLGKGTLFDYSPDLFEGGAAVLLSGIAAYEFTHGQYFAGGSYTVAAAAGAYPLIKKYGPKMFGDDGAATGAATEATTEGTGGLLATSAEEATAGTAGADWSGPIAAGVVLATTVGLYGYKLYTRVQQSNTYEGTNQTF